MGVTRSYSQMSPHPTTMILRYLKFLLIFVNGHYGLLGVIGLNVLLL